MGDSGGKERREESGERCRVVEKDYMCKQCGSVSSVNIQRSLVPGVARKRRMNHNNTVHSTHSAHSTVHSTVHRTHGAEWENIKTLLRTLVL